MSKRGGLLNFPIGASVSANVNVGLGTKKPDGCFAVDPIQLNPFQQSNVVVDLPPFTSCDISFARCWAACPSLLAALSLLCRALLLPVHVAIRRYRTSRVRRLFDIHPLSLISIRRLVPFRLLRLPPWPQFPSAVRPYSLYHRHGSALPLRSRGNCSHGLSRR
jgi:hypothetical protein